MEMTSNNASVETFKVQKIQRSLTIISYIVHSAIFNANAVNGEFLKVVGFFFIDIEVHAVKIEKAMRELVAGQGLYTHSIFIS